MEMSNVCIPLVNSTLSTKNTSFPSWEYTSKRNSIVGVYNTSLVEWSMYANALYLFWDYLFVKFSWSNILNVY